MAQELLLLSPEKTILSYRLAGIGARMIAHMVDLIIISSALGVLTCGLGFISTLSPGLATALMLISMFLGFFAYFIFFEAVWNGATPGKRVMNLRVRMADGTHAPFGAVMGRNLLRIADFMPVMYFAGSLAMFLNPRSQRLGDLVAGTVVIQERTASRGFRPAPHIMGVHPFEQTVGELRGMTLEEYNALKGLCDRFPELPTSVQDRLLREVWQPIAQNRGIPQVAGVHPVYLAEATVMRYGRTHGLL